MSRRDKMRARIGIDIWFQRQRINDRAHKIAMIDMFCEDFKFDSSNVRDCRLLNAKHTFIQKKWPEFTTYVQKNYKLWLELQYTSYV